MQKSIRTILEHIANLFRSILTGSKVSLVGKDGLQCSKDGEVYDNLKAVYQYGFFSRPPRGADALLLSNGDNRAQVVIGTKKGLYPELQEGESCIYSDKQSFMRAPKIRLQGKKISIGEGESELIGLLSKLIGAIPTLTPDKGAPFIEAKLLQDVKTKLEGIKV